MTDTPPILAEEGSLLWDQYFYDGGYGREMGRISPEGNIYGMTRRVRDVQNVVWWDGTRWADFEVESQVDSFDLLPTGVRPYGEIWRSRVYHADTNSYTWDFYYWDSVSSEWKEIAWYWTVSSRNELPVMGNKVGEAHIVLEPDVNVFWDGETWRRERHSSLDNDEPDLHLPPGFIQLLQPDAQVAWVSNTEIGIYPIEGGSGLVWVQSEHVQTGASCSVTNELAVLSWSNETQSITFGRIENGVDYWVYLANTVDAAYVTTGGDDWPAWDYRGKLFLSRTAAVAGYFGASGSGRNARLVGKVETDNTGYADGGPYFVRELDISIISRQVSLPETYREFSDFRLHFKDEDTLELAQVENTYGQIYCAGELIYLPSGQELKRDAVRIDWNGGEPLRDETEIAAASTYYVYLAGDVDAWNFNAINPATNRPWNPGDAGAGENYDADLDMRRLMFLSEKEPEDGKLDESWPGTAARHLGTVVTDTAGVFIPSRSVSAIRRAPIEPMDMGGVANVAFSAQDPDALRVVRTPGTNGAVYVADRAVYANEADDENCHTVAPSDYVYDYDGDNYLAPLSQVDLVSNYPNASLHLYLANDRECWGVLANKLFFCTSPPVGGYLSRDWPGCNARWMGDIRTDNDGRFGGRILDDMTSGIRASIADGRTSNTETWSSSQVMTKIQASQAAAIPTGVMLDFAGSSPPEGFLVCDGSAVGRAEYTDLFAVIGTTWGAGNGYSTFNVPDMRRRVAVGSGGTSTVILGNTTGSVGGYETHVLSKAEIPTHNHGGLTGETGITRYYVIPAGGAIKNWSLYPGYTSTQYGGLHTHSITNDGSGQSHNNVQPSAIVTKIIKT